MSKFLILAAAVALFAAACASTTAESNGERAIVTSTTPPAATTIDDGHDDEAAAATPDRTMEISMTEFAFSADPVEVKAGETIEFVVTNAGVVQHEFRLSNPTESAEHIAGGHEDHESTEGDHDEEAETELVLDAGETGTLVVTFPEDTTIFTEVACLLPGHYEAGMRSAIEYSA